MHIQDWPTYNINLIKQDTFKLMIQINGKIRGSIEVDNKLSNNELETICLESKIADKWIKNKKPKRVIVVPKKLVNIVI